MNSKIKITLLFVFTSFLVLPLSAQEKLSLADAIERGLANNFDILLEKKKIDIAKTNNSWGEAGRYPTIDLSLGQSNSVRNSNNPIAFFTGDVLTNSLDPRVDLKWTIFNGFKVKMSKNRFENLQKESQGNASIVIENTVQNLILAYYKAALEQKRIAVLTKTLTLSRDRYTYTKFKKELGSAVSSDVLLEETSYLTDSLNLINQELAFRDAVRNLNVILAEKEVDKMYQLTNELVFEWQDYKLSELQDKLLNNNVNLKKQYLSQEIARNDLAIAKTSLLPTLSLSSSFFNNRQSQDLSNTTLVNDTTGRFSLYPKSATTTYSFGLNLSFRIFNGGQVKRAIQKANINIDMNNFQVEKLQQSLNKDLSAAYDRYYAMKQLLDIAQRNTKVAEKNLEIFNERFKTGVINSFDYRKVQNTFINNIYNELNATYNAISSKTNLVRLTGGILEL
jgi:outer membrane protein TolC